MSTKDTEPNELSMKVLKGPKQIEREKQKLYGIGLTVYSEAWRPYAKGSKLKKEFIVSEELKK